ncbi:unnamed protein product (macronuclear) [Paramecium tetraurelia]|uniref:Uncharacterized protein n=1 Tax=Paramecium tetraurelia TaxID=5888 RepID=A0DYH3_PARTE|nr:uncharacterized protein GSPATT00003058001 [Paramecium tetraurelia]CAK88090.1 unnamed protein product [Paramecium tetraurelia]|eukprot:XP_001455487.1 hypothetical protein (macronuclear) [Paramecium tetraurelia strain d4-2]
MGCVTTKKQHTVQIPKHVLNQNSQLIDDDDQRNYNSAPQSPALRKIVQIDAFTPDEIKDFILERRKQNYSTNRIELMKKSGRYTPTLIYKKRKPSPSQRSQTKITIQSPIYPTQK